MSSHVTADYFTEQGLSPTFPARFFSKIRFTDSCWLWTGYRMPNGYGQISRMGEGNMMLAHRASWVLHFGPIPTGKCVLHDCPDGDNRACVNPAHLWIGTTMDNIHDCIAKGRKRFGISHQCGENNGMHKLKWYQVCAIRELWKTREWSQHQIAARFGVNQYMISMIVRWLRWKTPR